MDIGKVHQHMQEIQERRSKGRQNIGDRQTQEMIQSAKLVDRVDADVLCYTPDGEAVWEHYEGLADYRDEGGLLSLILLGQDADGDTGGSRMVLYPAGRWLKFTTGLTTLPNPYYVDPDRA